MIAGRRPGKEKPRIRSVRSRRGSALVVVLWALVALSALALSASVGAVVDMRLAIRHREHAAALGAAEAGIAEALAALRRDPTRATVADSVAGTGPPGSWVTRWSPGGDRLHLFSRGSVGSAAREIEVWADHGATAWRVVDWREIR
ncbi:MAG TPA: PilX N-terminal domain-containing pilus assembly protein [Gemmatimonadota bacterium]|nr:PilX N-terminal domain-containing pilus assembly protein [Gemmatimonadota bacterium]